jgi:mycofactocin precursor
MPLRSEQDAGFVTGVAAGGCMETTVVAEETTAQDVAPTEAVEQDLLVEDVSIDGMCGVY